MKASRKSLLWIWGACWDGVWRVWRVLERLERLESFGGFAGWQTAALKAHRKPLLWPGPGVPVGEVALALALGCLLGKWPCPVLREGVWNFGGLQPLRAGKRQL